VRVRGRLLGHLGGAEEVVALERRLGARALGRVVGEHALRAQRASQLESLSLVLVVVVGKEGGRGDAPRGARRSRRCCP